MDLYFVCLSDISGMFEPLNTVLFSSKREDETNRKVLVSRIKERFNIDLPKDLVDKLLCFKGNENQQYIDMLKKYVDSHR